MKGLELPCKRFFKRQRVQVVHAYIPRGHVLCRGVLHVWRDETRRMRPLGMAWHDAEAGCEQAQP